MASLASEFQKALSLDTLGKGRELRDPSKLASIQKAPKFVVRTVPDITKNTRIIAVCGCVDTDVEIQDSEPGADSESPGATRQTGQADPEYDGWFLSDFYAFKNILKDSGDAQKWITAENPVTLVQKYGTYLHGSPYYERKVVLSKELLRMGLAKDLVPSSRTKLKETFMQHLKEEAERARKDTHPLLVLIFGHGEKETKGIQLGDDEADLFSITDFRLVVGEGLDVTLVSTACFSGGWSVDKIVNASTMVAAGPARESESWPASPSVGRCCGSFYATALLKVWREESEASGESSAVATGTSSAQIASYAAFTEKVFDTLEGIDKFSEVHDLRFSAQDDDWTSAWGQRTGIPLSDFKSVWDKLLTVAPTADPDTFLNRSVHLPGSLQSPAPQLQQGSIRGRFGCQASLKKHVQTVARQYLLSFPGRDSIATNISLHRLLRKFLEEKTTTDMVALMSLYEALSYRTQLMILADQLLTAAGIPAPDKTSCANFDLEEFQILSTRYSQSDRARKFATANELINSSILPQPHKKQGGRWYKPHGYIAAALVCDENVKSLSEMHAAVARLQKAFSQTLTDVKKEVERNEEVRGSKAAWYKTLGKRLRSLSPEKRNKRSSAGGSSSNLPQDPW